MSIELTQLYKSLSDTQQTELFEQFRNAPKMLLLFRLLQQETLLNTNKAINTIYQQELSEGTEREVLTNRFYKLREKAKTALLDSAQKHPTFLCVEEQNLHQAFFLINQQDFRGAIQTLSALEDDYQARELYELLPNVYDLILLGLSSLEPIPKDLFKVYVDKKAKSLELKSVLEQLLSHHFQIFLDMEQYLPLIKKTNQLAKKYKSVRFELLHRYLALRFGIYKEKMPESVSKTIPNHFRAFYKLAQTHPNTPLFTLATNNRAHSELTIAWLEIIHYYFENNALKIRQLLPPFAKNTELIYFVRSETDLKNMILIAMQYKCYPEAHIFIQLLKDFQGAQSEAETGMPFYCLEVLTYVHQYPNHQPEQPLEYIKNIFSKISKNPKIIANAYEDLGNFCLLHRQYKYAEQCLKHPINIQHKKEHNLPAHNLEILQAAKNMDKNELENIHYRLQKILEMQNMERSRLETYKVLSHIAECILKGI
jgi:hypothetical protein